MFRLHRERLWVSSSLCWLFMDCWYDSLLYPTEETSDLILEFSCNEKSCANHADVRLCKHRDNNSCANSSPCHDYRIDCILVIVIVLLATTPRQEMHPAEYVFGSAGLVNQTGGWNSGLAFLFGLLSVQWTVRLVSK